MKNYTAKVNLHFVKGESDAGSSMQTGPHITPQPSISQPSTSQQQQPSAGEFSFLVPWRSMPRDLMERLEATSASKTRACPDDEKALRLAIGKKLRSAYDSFKDTHPGMQKTPGIDIYDNVTKQVNDLTFKNCISCLIFYFLLSVIFLCVLGF